jgi:hypothetical protein
MPFKGEEDLPDAAIVSHHVPTLPSAMVLDEHTVSVAVESSGRRSVVGEALSDCPFSITEDYAIDYLQRARAGADESDIRVPIRHVPTVLQRSVALKFSIHPDLLEPGRAHDELRVSWNAGSLLLPEFSGVVRFRIAGLQTRVIVEGGYRPPFGVLGRAGDALIGRRIAQSSIDDLAQRIARDLEARERAYRAKSV